MKTIALILAGGSGTRLWPLSRQKMPKQLLALLGERSLLQETCSRILPLVPPEDQWVICGFELYGKISEQIDDLRLALAPDRGDNAAQFIQVLVEPMGKNTAPAVFWAARRCKELYGEDTILLVLPADHLIMREHDYLRDLNRGIEKAAEGCLLTFGIQPSHAETAYGYIKIKPDGSIGNKPIPVEAFVEKPDPITAQGFLDSGEYLWNSGIFAFHVGTLLAEGQKLCPETLEPFMRCEPNQSSSVLQAYEKAKAQSIDCALMEKTNQAFVLPASFGWSDVGSWQGLFGLSEKDHQGNLLRGKNIVLDSSNCLIFGSDRLIAAVGMESVAIIDTPDVLMVCTLNQSKRVKEIVEELSKKQPEYT